MRLATNIEPILEIHILREVGPFLNPVTLLEGT